jgi:hypothetical protein
MDEWIGYGLSDDALEGLGRMSCSDRSVSDQSRLLDGPLPAAAGDRLGHLRSDAQEGPEGSLCERQTYPDEKRLGPGRLTRPD